ncbi:hypothetical protein GJ744_003288 [Endocarpon pusillum]|uniref:Uncharacterized protein n=1 Tax=Endocarpon pusillum TaxID=364733 RepID=A0A8H7AB02_9EURO|nr:hypothetical protein GJ744_003288 [Endocarpon pusillum]
MVKEVEASDLDKRTLRSWYTYGWICPVLDQGKSCCAGWQTGCQERMEQDLQGLKRFSTIPP